jgi:hypothetical protein
MTSPNAAPSVVVLNAQREQPICDRDRADNLSTKADDSKAKNCTVVENGKVVVKPVEAEEE